MAIPRDYYNYFDVCKMEGISENRAKNGIDKGLHSIAHIEQLKPISHLFKEFEKPVRGGMRKQYGIKRIHYDYFKKHGHAPKLSSGRPKKIENCVETRVYYPRAIYDEFRAIVDKANSQSVYKVSYRDMMAVALKEFNDRRRHILDGDNDVK